MFLFLRGNIVHDNYRRNYHYLSIRPLQLPTVHSLAHDNHRKNYDRIVHVYANRDANFACCKCSWCLRLEVFLRAICLSGEVMAHYPLILLFLLTLFWVRSVRCNDAYSLEVNRCSFPPHFVFGTATAAYQCEGAVTAGGRTWSIWDTFSHQVKNKIADGSNGDTADDQYHRYQEDILLMKNLSMDAYSFSISWSRIYPGGCGSPLNLDAVAHYNSLINGLLSHGIEGLIGAVNNLANAIQSLVSQRNRAAAN